MSERLIGMEEQHQRFNCLSVTPIYTMGKVVEIPQVIIKEHECAVIKPEIIERIIEVPKVEYKTRQVFVPMRQKPPEARCQERIVEVPQIVIEERVVHVPGPKEIQERLIEVPRVEYVERIEYDDFIEYREVPVDTIVEVPEIEYVIKEVEQLVPQTYIQEYYIDRHKEVPVMQIQEVERIERFQVQAPTWAPQAHAQRVLMQAPSAYAVPSQFTIPWSSVQSATSVPQGIPQNISMCYASYDPNKVGMVAPPRQTQPLISMVQPSQGCPTPPRPIASNIAQLPESRIQRSHNPTRSLTSLSAGAMPHVAMF